MHTGLPDARTLRALSALVPGVLSLLIVAFTGLHYRKTRKRMLESVLFSIFFVVVLLPIICIITLFAWVILTPVGGVIVAAALTYLILLGYRKIWGGRLDGKIYDKLLKSARDGRNEVE